MDIQELRNWEQAVDQSEQQFMTSRLPANAQLGTAIQDEMLVWQRVRIISGSVGARWLYWAKPGVKDNYDVIADKIFNGDVNHFVGMLATPYAPQPGVHPEAWALISPRYKPPAPTYVREVKPKIRYERSDEIMNLDTGEIEHVHKLPKDDAE